jgi:hypothetical protein
VTNTYALYRMHFLLVLSHIFANISTYMARDYSELNFLSIDFDSGIFRVLLATSFPLFAMVFALSAIIWQKKYFAVATLIFYSLFVYLPYFQDGKIDHSQSTLLYASISLIFFNLSAPLNANKNLIVLRCIQFALLSCYFNAGLWKMRLAMDQSLLEVIMKDPLNHIAYSITEGSRASYLVKKYLLDSSFQNLIRIGFLGAVLFQITSFLPLLKSNLIKYYGGLAILFHLLTGFGLGIYFSSTALVAALYLVAAEKFLKEDMVGFLNSNEGKSDSLRSH